MSASTLFAGAASVLIVAANPTEPVSETFADADHLHIEGFIGTVELAAGDSFSVELLGAPEGGPIAVDRDGDTVTITGSVQAVKRLYRNGPPYQKRWGSWNSDQALKKFEGFLGDYPVLRVTMPEGSGLKTDYVAMILDADMDFGEVDLLNLKQVYGTIGDSETANIGIGGMGELFIGDVANALEIAIGGSGDVYTGTSSSAAIRIGGSGDVELEDVSGPLDIRIGGSGDVTARDVGSIMLRVSGAGDVETQNVAGNVDVEIIGSGDFDAQSMNGTLDISVNGSGDVDIAGGRSTQTNISIHGSGDVTFQGNAADPKVRISGSGDVEITEYTGDVKVSGNKRDVRIGNLTFDD